MAFARERGWVLRRALVAAGLVVALVLVGRLAATPATAQQAGGHVHVANSGANSERVKTVPITRRAGSGQRVVMSLGPSKVRKLDDGDRVHGMGELHVSTTCLERMPKCVGRIYHFTPTVQARLVLASGPNAVRGRNVVPVSGWQRIRCSQRLPHRNHHCVLVVNRMRAIPDASQLPCENARCHLNMVVSAHNPRAKRGHQLVIGDDQNSGISQNKGQLSLAVYRPAAAKTSSGPLLTRERRAKRLKVGSRGGSAGSNRRVVYSMRLNNLRAGERLVVDARMRGNIKHLRYNTLVQSQLILSRRPDSTSRSGPPKRIGSFGAQVGVLNGFNCTRGRSAHPHPCTVRKNGVMRIMRDARARPWKDEGPRIPLYLNLVVGTKAVYGGRHRSRDRMRIRAKGGYIRVRRYGPEYQPGAEEPDSPPEQDDSLPDLPEGSLPPLSPPTTASAVIDESKRWVFPRRQIDEGATLLYANNDPGVRHNVTAKETGPDGRPLFQSRPFKGRTQDRPVTGTEYLPAGTYQFFCTFHPSTTGDGELTVREYGNGPVPRPRVALGINSSKLDRVVRSGRLKVGLRAAEPTPPKLELVARMGKRVISAPRTLRLEPGKRLTVGMKLNGGARKLLARRNRARVTVAARVEFGHPGRATKRLR